jgi:hypothetical protein
MGRTGRPDLIYYAIGDSACPAPSRMLHRAPPAAGPTGTVGRARVTPPRRSCTALYEAAPPAMGSTGTMGRARAGGATRRRMHISAPPAGCERAGGAARLGVVTRMSMRHSDRLLSISCSGGHGNGHVVIILFTSRHLSLRRTLVYRKLPLSDGPRVLK